ncbi:MAG: ATP-binding cassette domain-containing protein [Nitrospirota bacterium]|nr:ATP-binding cassette domain-containing protein [Nitrospirota bacterium]
MPGLNVSQLSAGGAGPYTLNVPPGECVGLIGASGAGKTRLLRAISDLDPHEGEVTLDDVPASGLPGHEWRRRVALLPADPRWWHATARAHLPEGGAGEAVAPEQLGLADELLDRTVARLSAGQRQRLALLRLLAREPHCLLLDEPTAHLDPESAARVEAVVAAYRQRTGAPVLWVGHDAAQLERVASRVLRLTPEGIRSAPEGT